MQKTRRCRVCGSETFVNRHHLIPRGFRKKGSRQMTIHLCGDNKGCRVHKRYHRGDVKAATAIRDHLKKSEIKWLFKVAGEDWVNDHYPHRLSV